MPEQFGRFVLPLYLIAFLRPTQVEASTDAAATIAALLNSYGTVPVSHVEHKRVPLIDDPRYRDYCQLIIRSGSAGLPGFPQKDMIDKCVLGADVAQTVTTNETLRASDITVISMTPVTFAPVTSTGVPDQLDASKVTYVNCSSQSTTNTDTLTVAFARTASIAVSDQLTNTAQTSANFSLKLTDALTIGGSVTLTTSKTVGTVDTTTYQTTVTRSHGFTASMAKMTALGAMITTYPIVYSAVFHTTATIDANLSANDKGLHKLSDILSVSQRTFPINGTVSFTDAADATTLSYDVTFDFSKCPANGALLRLPG